MMIFDTHFQTYIRKRSNRQYKILSSLFFITIYFILFYNNHILYNIYITEEHLQYYFAGFFPIQEAYTGSTLFMLELFPNNKIFFYNLKKLILQKIILYKKEKYVDYSYVYTMYSYHTQNGTEEVLTKNISSHYYQSILQI